MISIANKTDIHRLELEGLLKSNNKMAIEL